MSKDFTDINPAYAHATHEVEMFVHKDVVAKKRLIQVEVTYTPEQQRQTQINHVESLRRQIAELQREIDASLEWDCSVERKAKRIIGIHEDDPRFADEENYPTVQVFDPSQYAGDAAWINTPNP